MNNYEIKYEPDPFSQLILHPYKVYRNGKPYSLHMKNNQAEFAVRNLTKGENPVAVLRAAYKYGE